MKDTKKEILKMIKGGQVKMRPRWLFVVEALGTRGVWFLMLLGGSLAITAIIYFVRLYEPIGLISDYGEIGRDVLIEELPYLWIGGLVVFFGSGVIFLSKIGDNYKITVKLLVLVTALALLAVTGFWLGLESLLKFRLNLI